MGESMSILGILMFVVLALVVSVALMFIISIGVFVGLRSFFDDQEREVKKNDKV